MATQSSILTWRIPWTEEPGGLQSMGLQRVRYDGTNTCTAFTFYKCMCIHRYVYIFFFYSLPFTDHCKMLNIVLYAIQQILAGFPGGSEVKASACNARDLGSVPGSGRSPGEGNGNPLQYSCLANPMGGGAWWAIVHGVAKSRTRLSDFTCTFTLSILYTAVCIHGGGNDNPLQHSCLENPMDRGAWQATVHGVAKSRTQLSD